MCASIPTTGRPGETSGLERHDLVWLDAVRWRGALAAPLPEDALAALEAWFGCGRPAVVRRQESAPVAVWSPVFRRSLESGNPAPLPHENRSIPAGAGSLPDSLSLGVALPPSAGKRKIPLVVERSAVVRSAPPLSLDAVARSSPPHWRPWLEALSNAARNLGTPFSVYGSASWQCITGERYLTRSSDIDLLWRPIDAASLAGMLEVLACWERASGIPADGEAWLPDGAAVAWKEMRARPRQLLVKRGTGVELRPAAEVWAQLAGAPC